VNRRGFLGMLGRGAVAATIAPAVNAVLPARPGGGLSDWLPSNQPLAEPYFGTYRGLDRPLNLEDLDAALREVYSSERIFACVAPAPFWISVVP
jgi:hypothetical protein